MSTLAPVHTNPVAPAGTNGGNATRSRISAQRDAVWNAISTGQWYTLAQLEWLTGHPQASISARLRDFRKSEFGGHTIERRYQGGGTYGYRRRLT